MGCLRDLEMLLKQGADPNLILPEGIAPVHLASGKERESAIRCLNLILQHGGDPNARSVEELTPLHVAASWGCSKCLKLLLIKGGDPTLQDQDGNRAIDLAMEQGNRRCAFILQEYDRSADHRDCNDDWNLQSEDSTETINFSELSDAGPWNSTQISLLCSLPGKAQLDNHLSDTVVASSNHRTSFMSDLQESLCHSAEPASVGSPLPLLGTGHSSGGPGFSELVNCNNRATPPFSQLSHDQPHHRTLNISHRVAARDLPARESALGNPETCRIVLPTSDTYDEGDSAAVRSHNHEPHKASNGSASVYNGLSKEHLTTTLSTAAGDGTQSCELSGICPLGGISKESLSPLNGFSVVRDSDTVISRLPGSDLEPKLARNKGLDVTSPDHVYLFCLENSSASCDLEKTLLHPRISASRDDDQGVRLNLHHHDLSSDSEYSSCHSECYISVSEVSGYDGSKCSAENKGNTLSETHRDSTSYSRRGRAGSGAESDPADVENIPGAVRSFSFGDSQEGRGGCTMSKETVISSVPQTSQMTCPVEYSVCQNGQGADSRCPMREKKAKATVATATQDTAPTDDVPDGDCGLDPADFGLRAQLKALMLSTNKYKSSPSRGHVTGTEQPEQVNNKVVFGSDNTHKIDTPGTGSTSLTRTVSQSEETLPVEVVVGKTGMREDEEAGNSSEELQHRTLSTKLEIESQQRNETADTLTTDFCTDRAASAGSGSQATLSSELRRMMIATKSLQSPLPLQDERPCFFTPRTKSRVTSSSSRSRNSSTLFEDSLEMPQRCPRVRTPRKGCNSPYAYGGTSDDTSQEESQLHRNGGSSGHLQQATSKERETLSLDDTQIIEKKVACGSSLCKTSVQKAIGAGENASPTVLLRSQGSGVISGGKPDSSSLAVLVRSQGCESIRGGEPDSSSPSVLVKSQGDDNFSDFFTEDQSSSFTDEPTSRALCINNFHNPPLILDVDNGMSDNTWLTEDGDHDVYTGAAGHARRSSLNRPIAELQSGVGSSSAVKPCIGRSIDVLHSTQLEQSPLLVEEEGSPLRPRYSFSRLSIIGSSGTMPVVSTNLDKLSPIEDLSSFNINLSPGGRPVNSSINEPVEYLYMDPEEGHALIERHFPCTDDSTQDSTSSNDTILYDWTTYKRQLVEPEVKGTPSRKIDASKILPELYRLSNDDILAKLREFGENPGPVTSQTRRVYLALLDKLMKDPRTKGVQCSGYSPELSQVLQTFQIPDVHEDEMTLSKQFDQPDKNKKWREGVLKSSFNYLLLDPRVTRNLPSRCFNLSQHECFRTFISAVFYVGKGKRSRPYSHLYEALTHYKGDKKQACQKVQHILDIWQTDLGVVSLHCFQNAIPVEAYTREACMVDAIGLKMLTNQKKGNYYGYAQDWPMKRRRRLGVHMLHRAMQIFLAEGERQLRPADIRIGQ